MTATYSSLPLQLLGLYNSGMPVSAISTLTGLKEEAVVTRLCVAARSIAGRHMEPLAEDGGMGIQWGFVYWRA